MKKSKKLESLQQSIFHNLGKLTGGNLNPPRPEHTTAIEYTLTGLSKIKDAFYPQDGPKDRSR